MPSTPDARLLAELYLTAGRAYLPRPAPDGSLWFASDLPGHAQVFRLDQPMGWPVRAVPNSLRTLPVAHTRHGLLVRQDRGGNETWQLALVTEGGTLQPVTSDERAIHQSPTVNPDGERVGLAYNPGGQVDFTLAVLDLATGRLEPWLERSGMWRWSAWNPDGSAAAVEHVLSPTRSESYVLRPGGEPVRLLAGARRVSEAAWAGPRLLALSDLDSEFMRLLDAESGRTVFEAEGRDVVAFVADPKGGRAAVVVNAGACDELVLIDLESGIVTKPEQPAAGDGIVYTDNVNDPASNIAWSADGAQLFVAWETALRPADILDLQGGRRWTAAGDSTPEGGTRPEDVAYRSFDGLEVPALLYRARTPGGPTVVNFHGGPEGQARAGFQPFVQLFVAAGLNVLTPNVRGSTGYGVRYFSLDDRELRWDSVRDGCEAARWLKREHPGMRVAAMGGSYGGFMTLAVLVEDPSLWDAAVDIVGIADWHSFFRTTSGWRRALRTAEYGDPEQPGDADFLARFSPLRRAASIRAPMLVIHGRNDVRVPLGEAEQIAAATGSELLVFDDEGHGIVRHGNRVRAYGRALEFLLEKLEG
jgi:dienelactone hydrolase